MLRVGGARSTTATSLWRGRRLPARVPAPAAASVIAAGRHLPVLHGGREAVHLAAVPPSGAPGRGRSIERHPVGAGVSTAVAGRCVGGRGADAVRGGGGRGLAARETKKRGAARVRRDRAAGEQKGIMFKEKKNPRRGKKKPLFSTADSRRVDGCMAPEMRPCAPIRGP